VQHTTGTTSIGSVQVMTGAALSVSSSTLNLTDTAVDSRIATLTENSGTISGAADIIITGTYEQQTGGVMSGAGTTSIASGASWLTFGSTTASRAIMIEHGGGGSINSTMQFGSNGSIANAGTLTVNGNVTQGGTPSSLDNWSNGTLIHSGGVAAISVDFSNYGVVRVNAGTFTLRGGSFSGGSYQVASGATFATADGFHEFNYLADITGSGTMSVTSVFGNTAFDAGMTFTLPNLSVTDRGNLFNDTDLTVTSLFQESSHIDGTGDITVTGSYSQNGGNVAANSPIGSGASPALTIAPGATWTFNGGLVSLGRVVQVEAGASASIAGTSGTEFLRLDGGTVINAGTITLNAGSGTTRQLADLGSPPGFFNKFINSATGTVIKTGAGAVTIAVPFTNNGTVQANAGTLDVTGAFSNYDQGTRVLTGGTYDIIGTFRFTAADIVTNQASITLNGASSKLVDTSNLNGLRNLNSNGASGSLTIKNGRNLTRTNASLSSAGTLTVGSGSKLTCSSLTLTGGVLQGIGTVSAIVVSNTGGTVKPGTSPGILSFTVGYIQGSGGRLEVDVAGTTPGTGFDRLSMGAGANLNGTLTIVTDSNFTPDFFDSFQILTASSRSGTFATVQGSNLGGGKSYTVLYGASDVTLTVPFNSGLGPSSSTNDAPAPSSSPPESVEPETELQGALLGSYATTSQGARVYHYSTTCGSPEGTGCPVYVVQVTPDHQGQRLEFVVQQQISGTWTTIVSGDELLDVKSRASYTFTYTDDSIVNQPLRISATLGSDGDHAEASSPWSYFGITA
jgi:fibronectin-binding autotransporter adhesin